MISEAIYWVCKLYFMFIWLVYLYALFGPLPLETFAHLTGVISILFLGSNLNWHLRQIGN